MPSPNEIRSDIEAIFGRLITAGDTIISNVQGYGHQAGKPIENWVKNKLSENEVRIFLSEEYFQRIFSGKETDIEDILDSTWWGSKGYRGDRFLISRAQIRALRDGNTTEFQQGIADLVLCYGEIEEYNKVILINVKSHNTTRVSRDPNIMSAQRLLYFLKNIITKEFELEDVNYWFIGVDYHPEGSNAIIDGIHIRDLFKIDLDSLPMINFDAAIQIQWHVSNMIECEQTKEEFIKSLANTFLMQWKRHSSNKTRSYDELVKEILERI